MAKSHDRPMVEWVAGALSCAIVAALVAFLLHRALSQETQAPALSVAVEAVEQVADGALVRIALVNRGDATAATVRVRAVRRDEPGTAREIEFDYIAGHAVRRGAFAFAGAPPAPEEIEIGIVGFVEP